MTKGSPRAINLAGQRFGRLLVEERDFSRKERAAHWFCLCDCGTQTSVLGDSLRKGHTHSCGCLARELTVERSSTHGLSNHPLYTVWQGMIARCHSPEKDNFKYYGGRGIAVCPRWHDVDAFIEDMAPGYSDGLTIDRIDNDKGYEPGNVRWASKETQARNTRRNVWLVTPFGVLLLADALILWTEAECRAFVRVKQDD